jgi:PRC-barrel domain
MGRFEVSGAAVSTRRKLANVGADRQLEMFSLMRNARAAVELSDETHFVKERPMARATAHPDHRCISSEDIQGTEVYGAGGKNIGEIDHLIIDKVSGRVPMPS